jgi:hypothetical protein
MIILYAGRFRRENVTFLVFMLIFFFFFIALMQVAMPRKIIPTNFCVVVWASSALDINSI